MVPRLALPAPATFPEIHCDLGQKKRVFPSERPWVWPHEPKTDMRNGNQFSLWMAARTGSKARAGLRWRLHRAGISESIQCDAGSSFVEPSVIPMGAIEGMDMPDAANRTRGKSNVKSYPSHRTASGNTHEHQELTQRRSGLPSRRSEGGPGSRKVVAPNDPRRSK